MIRNSNTRSFVVFFLYSAVKDKTRHDSKKKKVIRDLNLLCCNLKAVFEANFNRSTNDGTFVL